MKKIFIFLSILLLLKGNYSSAQIFWTENFESGSTSGTLVTAYTGPNGTWTLATGISTTEGDAPNPWYVSCAENGHTAGICGTGCMAASSTATRATLHIGASATAGAMLGDMGASYDAGGLCGISYCVNTDRRAESPTINCTTKYGITMSFYYIENGDGAIDDGTVWYYDGSTWSLLVNTPKTTVCTSLQGQWAHYSIALPSSADNNANVKIGFRWVNNDDAVGTDPSFAIDSVSLSTVPSGLPTITTNPSNTTICSGGTTSFIVVASGATTYQWQRSTTGTGGTFVNITTGMDGGIYGSSFSTATLMITGATTADNGFAYQLVATNSSGSVTSAPALLTVDTVPSVSAILGSGSVCVGTTTTLVDGTTGGTWSSATPTVATVGASNGVVAGVAAGTDVISYSVMNSCGTTIVTFNITVTTTATAGTITGPNTGCVGSTLTLTDGTSGGVWSSTLTSIATINPAGVVTGILLGIDVISYSITSSCGPASATYTITINSAVSAGTISGTDSVCKGSLDSLSDGVTGGKWSSSDTTIVSIDSTYGTAMGINTGTAIITYTAMNPACGTATATFAIMVKPTPHPAVYALPGHILAVHGTYTSYQWEKTGTNIAGATSATYVFTVSANYQVTVDSGGCYATSSSHTFNLGVEALVNSSNSFGIAQTGNMATIYANLPLTENIDVDVYDLTGRLLAHEIWANGSSSKQLKDTWFANGIYIIRLSNENTFAVLKWIKQ